MSLASAAVLDIKRRLWPAVESFRDRRDPRTRAHFLHINKTAGTALIHALQPVAHGSRYNIKFHPHHITLADVPPGEPFFFSVRDPLDRFVSGFNGRQRRGYPRYVGAEWSPEERAAFETFPDPDALGRALSSEDPEERQAARDAMGAMVHIRHSYWRWFVDEELFRSRVGDLLLILHQSRLAQDFDQLVDLLGVSRYTPALPADDVAGNRAPDGVNRALSSVAVTNLRKWYARDYAFLDLCAELQLAGQR